MRVIVAPGDVAPTAITDAALFQPKADAGAVAPARAAEAEEAAKKANEARLAVVKASREAAQAMMPIRVAELQPKLDAVGPAREAAVAAEAVRAAANEEVRKTARDLEPMSIFISRRTNTCRSVAALNRSLTPR
jgi:hypothetical protein